MAGSLRSTWSTQNPEAATLEGIRADPDLVGKRFDNCPDGWGCRTLNDNMNKVIDMQGNGIEVFNLGSGEPLATAIASAYADKAPWFGFSWSPTAILGKYPMVQVDLGGYNETIHGCKNSTDCTEPGISPYGGKDRGDDSLSGP